MAQKPAQQPPPKQQQGMGPVGEVLVAAGAAAGALAPAAVAAGATVFGAEGVALGAATEAQITAKVLAGLRGFNVAQVARAQVDLTAMLRRAYPEKPVSFVDKIVAEEITREREFQRRMMMRLQRDIPKALEEPDADGRRARLQKLLAREQRYIAMRGEAMTDRAIAAAERDTLKEASPAGAFWHLSPHVHQHTPDCIAMGGKFWPWKVLDTFHPPTHPGCQCMLLTAQEALERGYLEPHQLNVDLADAVARAKHAMSLVKKLHEAGLTRAELGAYLEEAAVHRGAMIALYPRKATRKKLAAHPHATEPAEDIHATLVFLGPDNEAIDDATYTKIRDAIKGVAAQHEPLSGEVGGIGAFKGDGETHPLIALADVPGLNELRAHLANRLDKRKVDYAKDHGFTPHLTLSYLAKDDEHPVAEPPAGHPLDFDAIHLVRGGTHEVFPLGKEIKESIESIGINESRATRPQKCKRCAAPATKSLVWAEGAAYVPVCDDHEGEVRKHLGPHSVDAVLKIREELEEARYEVRYAKGTAEGGRFMPRVGARPHFLSHLKHELLRQLAPNGVPRPPAHARSEGRHVVLHGRPVFVPTHRNFKRAMGGYTYTSPVGSDLVYRDGKTWEPRGSHHNGIAMSPGELGLPTAKKQAVAELAPAVDAHRAAQEQRIADAVSSALVHRDKTLPPAIVGESGWLTDQALRQGGFVDVAVADEPDGIRFAYFAPDSSSALAVVYAKDGSTVREVRWTPQAPETPGEELKRPPRTWDEFRADLDAFARRTAIEHGHHALLADITVDPKMFDHVAEHQWSGRIAVAPAVRDDILAAAAQRARLGKLEPSMRASVYASTLSALHEALHAANPCPLSDYDGAGMVLEEGLTEEIAHLETVKHLRLQGQSDVVQWAADNPDAFQRLGSYASYRAAIDDVLNDARIPVEQRQEFLTRLKLDTRPAERIPLLAAAVARAHGEDPTDPAVMERRVWEVADHLVQRGKPHASFDAVFDAGFVPGLIPDAEPSPNTGRFEIAGDALELGDYAVVNRHLDGATVQEQGTVRRLYEVDGGWAADVDFGDTVEYAVLPHQIAEVSHQGDSRIVWGAHAGSLTLGDDVVRDGDIVRYDGRVDGGYSEARIVRILRASNPQAETDDWAIEAVTTRDSLQPGARVILTPERVGGKIELAHTAVGGLPGHGGMAAVPLEAKAKLQRHFDFSGNPGALIVPTERLVPHAVAKPSLLHRLVADFNDPVGNGGKRQPLAVAVRGDGRLDVLHGGELVRAAEMAGVSHLPVKVSGLARQGVLAEITRDLVSTRQHVQATGGSQAHVGKLSGLRAAARVVRAGGGQADLLRAALEHGELKPELGSFDDGYQGALRSVWMLMDDVVARHGLAAVSKGREGSGWAPVHGEGPVDARGALLTHGELLRSKWDRAARGFVAKGQQGPPLSLEDLKRRHPGVELQLSRREHGLVVSMVRTPEDARGKGLASAAMRDVLAYADRYGLAVGLTPEPVGKGMSKTGLTRWYRSLGFVPNKGKDLRFSESMIRPPQPTGVMRSSPPSAAMMAADLVPAAWRVEHGYGEIVPNIGFRYVPYKPIPGGMTEEDALRMLHHFFTGKPDEWIGKGKGSKAQRDEVERAAIERWREHMKQRGWLDVADDGGKRQGGNPWIPGGGGEGPKTSWVPFDPLLLPQGGEVTVVGKTGEKFLVRKTTTAIQRQNKSGGWSTVSSWKSWLVQKGPAQTQLDLPAAEPKEPVPFDVTTLGGQDKALVRFPDGSERVVSWGSKKDQVWIDNVKGPLAQQQSPVSEIPDGTLYLGRAKSSFTFAPPKPKWDDSHTVQTLKPAGGSNGAMIGETETGEQWLVKSYRGDQDRIATELLANAIYRKMGVPVPVAGELHFDGKPALAYPLLPGEPGGHKSGLRIKQPSRALAHDFMVDALVANWDVIGLEHDNLLWPEGTTPDTLSPDTQPIRLDQGGSLAYRAMGSRKPFGPVPSEVWSMASPKGGQAYATMVLTPNVKREGAARIAKKLTPKVIDDLVDAAPFKDEKMRAEVREALKARVGWMGQFAAGKVAEPEPLSGATAAAALHAAQGKTEPPPEQAVAVDAWRDGWDAVVNEHLRSGAPKDKAAKEVAFLVREMDEAIRHAKAPADMQAYFVLPGPVEGAIGLVDKTLSDKGFLQASTDAAAAIAAQEKNGGVIVRLTVPEGAPALYLEGVKKGPDVVLARGARVRVLRLAGPESVGSQQLDALLVK